MASNKQMLGQYFLYWLYLASIGASNDKMLQHWEYKYCKYDNNIVKKHIYIANYSKQNQYFINISISLCVVSVNVILVQF